MGNKPGAQQCDGGIVIHATSAMDLATVRQSFLDQAAKLGLGHHVETTEVDGQSIRFRLRRELQREWAPGHDTLQLGAKLNLTLTSADDLEKEILLAMLVAPVAFEFPSQAELAASIRIRRNIVEAALRTVLAFHTTKIERPKEYWTYSEESGFTVLPGKPLIEALRMATQPDMSGRQYAFSCYRASEYVVLLGIAQGLAEFNPGVLQQLQQRWESRAIMSQEFHDVFLREYGSMSQPLPAKFYVPGDRLWFRNPDEHSSDVAGYEGSWVIYLGGGLFSNFWKCGQPFSMIEKCVEIYHWRNGTYRDAQGDLQMDEGIVEQRARATLNDPVELERILERMMRMRDPSGVYAEGGCIDATREYPRRVHPDTSDIIFPLE